MYLTRDLRCRSRKISWLQIPNELWILVLLSHVFLKTTPKEKWLGAILHSDIFWCKGKNLTLAGLNEREFCWFLQQPRSKLILVSDSAEFSNSNKIISAQLIFPPYLLFPETVYFSFLLSKVLSHSVVSDSATAWTVGHQAPLSMEFSRQEYWSGLPRPPPGIFPTQGSSPGLPHSRQILCQLSHQGSPMVQ